MFAKHLGCILGISLTAATVATQSAIPAGTLIPVSLDGGLDAKKAHAGQRFHADVMQDIPGTEVKRRAKLLGHVVEATRGTLEIAFDEIRSDGQQIPVRTSLRAIASFNEVEVAQVPEDSMDRGITPETATTTQIGGEQVYRGGGHVVSGETVVGEPTPWGVVGQPRGQRGTPCRAVVNGDLRLQAFWLFSTDACGTYGMDEVQIERAGRNDPQGIIVLTSNDSVNLRSGTGMLLRVIR